MFYSILLGKDSCLDAMDAWAKSVSVYRAFRQQRNQGSGPRPGRSRWTEPDVLRSHANRRDIDTRHIIPINDIETESFPRIILGAPIIFHSQSENALKTNVDIIHKKLGKKIDKVDRVTDRMASPVIIRPIYYKGTWRAGLLILKSPDEILESIDGVYVHSEKRTYPTSAIKNDDIRTIKAFEMSKYRPDNAIDALVDFAQANGFKNSKEVTQ